MPVLPTDDQKHLPHCALCGSNTNGEAEDTPCGYYEFLCKECVYDPCDKNGCAHFAENQSKIPFALQELDPGSG